MSDYGKNILSATREIRQLFEDISLLLLSGTELMVKEGWTSCGNVASAGGSQSINNPSYWMPLDLFKFLTHKQNTHLLSFISVIIDDVNDPGAMEEPLISAGWLDYGKGNKVGNSWSYGFSRMALSADNWSSNGDMMEVPREIVVADSERTIQRARALAYPLVKIADVKSIENLVTNPLIKDIQELT